MKDDREVKADATFGKWCMLPFAIISFGISVGFPVSLSIMFLDWQESFQGSRAQTAVIHSTCVGFLFGGAIIPGYIMKRFGARLTTLMGSVLASIGFFLSMFATSIEYLVVTAGIFGGLGCCFIQITSIPCITAVFDKHLSLIISSCTICSAAINALFPYLYDYMMNEYSWREIFGITSCVVLNTCVSGMIMTSITYKSESSSVLPEEEIECSLINGSDTDKTSHKEQNTNAVMGGVDQEKKEMHSQPDIEAIEYMQSKVAKCSDQNMSLVDNSKTNHKSLKNIFERIKKSDWKFLVDPVFISFIVHTVVCLACIFSFPLLITEYSKNEGFDKSTGGFFFSVIFISSTIGRMFAGLLNLSPRFHSITLYTCFSIGNMITMFLLSFIQDYLFILICLSMYGICFGAVIGLQMKCILDIQSVKANSYSLALGFCITAEGIVDFIIPIIIASSVDATGSYSLILVVMGCVGLVSSILLGIVFKFLNKQKEQTENY